VKAHVKTGNESVAANNGMAKMALNISNINESSKLICSNPPRLVMANGNG
jgi:hypothetical protein